MNANFKSGKIKLVYWNEPNFGDMLSPYIVGKLSGQKIIYKDHYRSVKVCFRKLLKNTFFQIQRDTINTILVGEKFTCSRFYNRYRKQTFYCMG